MRKSVVVAVVVCLFVCNSCQLCKSAINFLGGLSKNCSNFQKALSPPCLRVGCVKSCSLILWRL